MVIMEKSYRGIELCKRKMGSKKLCVELLIYKIVIYVFLNLFG